MFKTTTLALALSLSGLAGSAHAATAPAATSQQYQLQGTWISVTSPNTYAQLYNILSIQPAGRVAVEMIATYLGEAVTVYGSYTYNASNGSLQLIWDDYEPKAACVITPCKPGVSPLPLNVKISETVTFETANFMTFNNINWSRVQ
ncbi:MAG TPA: hypothetical protein VEK34_13055 [Methylocella sp.]|nr:hypothetical protein [Methylocella sp.]